MFGFDILSLVETAGYIGLAAIVFAESGLFFGFFLPGDSLLFIAGFLASQEHFSIWILVPLLVLSGILGDSVGYTFGRRVGPRIFSKKESRFFHPDHILRTKVFYEKYGNKTILLARFIPIVRTFAPILAGVGNMRYRTFALYNIIGGVAWGAGMTLFGYYLGSFIPDADKYVLPIVVVIIVVSILPNLIQFFKKRN